MSPAARAIWEAALNLQDGVFRSVLGGYLELTGRGLARDRLRWVVKHDRDAVPCGRWVHTGRPHPLTRSEALKASIFSHSHALREVAWRWSKPRYRWKERR